MSQLEDVLYRVTEVAKNEAEIIFKMLETANNKIKKVEDSLINLNIKRKFHYSERVGVQEYPYDDDPDGNYKALSWKKCKNNTWKIVYSEYTLSFDQDHDGPFLKDTTTKEVPLLEAPSDVRIEFGGKKLESFLNIYIEEAKEFISKSQPEVEK